MTAGFARIDEKIKQRLNSTTYDWSGLLVVTFVVAQLYVLMEWVFLVTKPSFLDMFSLPDKLQILFLTGSLAASVSLLGLAVLFVVGRIFTPMSPQKGLLWLAGFLPAGILAALVLLMVDNFTYTVFSFGIATTLGLGRILYLGLFLVLIVWSLWQVTGGAISIQRWLGQVTRHRAVSIVIGAWLVVGLAMVFATNTKTNASLGFDANEEVPTSRPHIIWITGDGISATHLSLYGYERDTSPNLRALAESSLVADNVFTNAKNTLGSLTSMFTGKPAIETRVMYSPDILLGDDAYQHLPGILRSYGYYAIQYGYQFYVDAYVVNLMDGFDVSNGRSIPSNPIQVGLRKYLPEGVAYFVFESGNRIVDRLRHIAYIKEMQNPRETLASSVPALSDDERLAAFFDDLDRYGQPMFIHLHYLGTHGALFELKEKVFSAGRASTDVGWDRDFFDDAILEFDMNVGRIVDALEKHGLLENTILIIGSDHAANFDQRQRIPLLIRFPGGGITGKIKTNVQNLDISPTILDYMGLPKPDWMCGESLLNGDLPDRNIYGTGARTILGEEMMTGEWLINPQRLSPPFYQLGAVSLIDCQRWYELDLVNMSLKSGDATGHTAPCPESDLLTLEQAYELLLAFMRENNYDISSLEKLPFDSLLAGN